MNTFKADIEEIRRRARDKMDDGAVTAFYKADRAKVVDVLNEVLATETVCTLRYRNHYFTPRTSTPRDWRPAAMRSTAPARV